MERKEWPVGIHVHNMASVMETMLTLLNHVQNATKLAVVEGEITDAESYAIVMPLDEAYDRVNDALSMLRW